MNPYLRKTTDDRRRKPIRMGDRDGSPDRRGDASGRPDPANEDHPVFEDEAPAAVEPDDAPQARRSPARKEEAFRPLPGAARATAAADGDDRRGPIVLGLAVVILGLFGFVVWNAYRDGVRPDGEAAAPVIADAGPFKTRAAGGEGDVDPQIEAEVLEQAAGPETQELDGADAGPVDDADATEPTPEAPPPRPEVVAEPPEPLAPPPSPSETSPPAEPAMEATPATRVLTPARGGPDVVQLAAAGSEAAARAEWSRRAAAAPDLFSRVDLLIQTADVGGRTVFRVRAQGFADRAEAEAFCAAIKFRGGDCFRTTR